MTYKIQMRRFEYVPAAITARGPDTFLGMVLQDNRANGQVWKRTRFNGLTTHYLPDRTVYMGRSSSALSCVADVDFDQFMMISPCTHPEVLSDAGFRYAMASPHHVSTDTETRRNRHVKLFCDSGGFQLHSGASDWIDMDELATFYNRTVDYGVGLDIPTGGEHQEQFSLRMCEVMLKNNRYIRERLNPEVELYDVIHGNTLKLRSAFTQRVLEQKRKEKRGMHGLCVAGIAQNMSDGGAQQTVINGTVNMMYVLDQTKGEYERYHVLGTTNSFFQFLYHVILAHDIAPYITADSTSYMLPAANNQSLEMRTEPNHSMLSLMLPKTHNAYQLRCACPVCQISKYAYEYHVNAIANSIHNLYATAQQRERVEETAQQYLNGEITLEQGLATATGDSSPKMIRVFAAAVRFAEDAAKRGFKYGWSKHRETMSHLMRDGIKKVGLWGDAPKTKSYKEKEARLDFILKKYEDFHANLGKNKKGKK